MSDVIHLLPDAVANQIAAGEVIQRPASVLKELVENAIDAGADYIQIVIRDAGRTLIQVTDNGKGMSITDARLAFERHATSKISDARDLFSLRTMGFRGEALASIAAIAQVEMRTRREEDELGTLIEMAGSRLFRQEPVQCAKGTSFLIKNLFFNVPARRRFLKSDSVEKNHLLQEFYRIVLVNPEVEFSLFDGEDEIFRLPVTNIKVRIEQVFGSAKRKLSQQLLSIETQTSIVNIKGFVGRPEFAQKTAQQYFFVNGRYMRHPYFHKSIMLAYSQLIASGDNPFYFIYFEVDPQTIDINIHPTKTEIKFENEQALWSILSAAVKEALGKFNVVPSIDFDTEGVPEMPTLAPGQWVKPPSPEINTSYNPFNPGYSRPPTDWSTLYKGFEQTESESLYPENEQNMFSTQHSSFSGVDSSSVYDLQDASGEYFQLKSRYIITSVKSGMLIVDQRRAHIRILYDEYVAAISRKRGFSQQLLFPESFELLPEDEPFFNQVRSDLSHLGFDIESSSRGEYTIKGIPSGLKGTDPVVPLLNDIIERVKLSTGDALEDLHHQMALSLAGSAAIAAVQKLSQPEMKDLIERLFACTSHHHTPDGKVILNILTQEEIYQRLS